ncbi:stage III sporulation protein SpoIIIAB [Bacillus sp. CLL-7-23]|uniref:Stage III sporulation protein SpoIIIAB n=1 Tax=Bacillus changyiensis TaxID=3004103 RepID=A0ABT4X3X2_9BACI|nr:stage III sporulation protein SpoIIIAB [Bacillus changyiensis]MDA7026989.1 stage III sporulation protein SpoIIIAB [Bacillus changyiensis]
MLKLLGAAFILVTVTWMGFEMAKPFSERPKQIRQLLAALQSLEAEIMYGHTPLCLASKHVANQLAKPISSLFVDFAEKLEEGRATAGSAWEDSLQKVWPETALKKKEIDILKQFGETLGKHDLISQQKHIKLAITHLETEEAEANLAQAKNEKMVKSLGFLAGLLLILLLM